MKIELSLRQVEVLALELQSPLLLDASTTVADTVQAMREQQLGYALIMAEDRLIGIFTERDVFLAVIGNPAALSRPVSDLMTRDPVTVAENDPVGQVVIRMHEGGFRQVPVTDSQGHVVACVRHKDVAQFMANHFADRVLNLPPDPEQHARTPGGG
jgi:CBS domain-containing protein